MKKVITSITFLLCFLFCIPSSGQVKNFGWVPKEVRLELSTKSSLITDQNSLDSLPVTGNDAYLWRYLYSSLKKTNKLSQMELESGRLSSLNQGNVGSCVGYASCICLDIAMGVSSEIKKSNNEEFIFRCNPDVVYAIGRSENRGRWDGSRGVWSVAGLSKYGSLHIKQYDGFSLLSTKPEDGRNWSAQGLPSSFLKFAEEHKLISYEQVKSIEQAKKAIQNGYPILICAQASYAMKRDSTGFARRTGDDWAHAMAVVGYRSKDSGTARGNLEGFLIQNSWGNSWQNGGIYPTDMPRGSFWVKPNDLLFHLNQGDSYAISRYTGFERQILTWEEVFSVN